MDFCFGMFSFSCRYLLTSYQRKKERRVWQQWMHELYRRRKNRRTAILTTEICTGKVNSTLGTVQPSATVGCHFPANPGTLC